MPASPGLIIAAPASGSGKTVVTLALLRALRNAGVKIASAKAGPDYIDPAFHRFATGRACINLDPWAM
ncbi:MAG: cobyrinic acid a,c-diamide synthase, partial [Alphaproteobacteria bacterium]